MRKIMLPLSCLCLVITVWGCGTTRLSDRHSERFSENASEVITDAAGVSMAAQLYYIVRGTWPQTLEDLKCFRSDDWFPVGWAKYERASFSTKRDGTLQIELYFSEDYRESLYPPVRNKFAVIVERPDSVERLESGETPCGTASVRSLLKRRIMEDIESEIEKAMEQAGTEGGGEEKSSQNGR